MAIKRPNIEDEYSPEQIQELRKCKRDPMYFIENYIYVQHPTQGKVQMKLYDYQKRMLMSIHENKDTIILASRQLGKCVTSNTMITTTTKPTGLKAALLWALDRKTYNQLCTVNET